MLLSSLLAAQLAFAAGCGDEVAPVSPEDATDDTREMSAVQPSIRDGAHDGPEGFYFLPPETRPGTTGAWSGSLRPWDGDAASGTAGPGSPSSIAISTPSPS